jgi:hypothetical protein
MKCRIAYFALITIVVLVLGVSTSMAATVIGGITFDDNAFADKVPSYSGSWEAWGPGGIGSLTLEEAMTGSNLTTYGTITNNPSAWAVIKFTDNFIKNGAGADLAVFEISGTSNGEPVSITINGTTNVYNTLYIGYANASVARIDLSDFGIASGALVNTIQANGVAGWDPDYAVFGAINNASVPLPSALLLFAPGLVGLMTLKRKYLG